MIPFIHSKILIAGHATVVRQYPCFIPRYSSKQIKNSTVLLYTYVKKPKCDILENSIRNEKYIQIRTFYMSPTWSSQESSSKIEETVKNIKEQKELKEKVTENISQDIVQSCEKALEKKLTLWQKVKAEALHYYHGFRLLGLDMKVSAKLIWRILHGKELSRREHRLLIKTTGDMFRLIPFSVFIVVPFMEFLLPVAIKLFPGLLPSTFQTSTEKEDKLKQALKVKIEMAKFLQKTLDDMAVQSSDHKSVKAKEFVDFFYKVRTTGAVATNEEIMMFSKLFEDEITLDSLSRPQLIALCRVLDVQTFGTTNFLCFLLRLRLRSLAADDKLIQKEGVDSLTRNELQQACRARGMRAYGLPESKLREQLSQWLDLSLVKKVPPSLLLLSRALMVPDTIPMSDKLKATISALPDAVVARTKRAIGEKEGKLDHRTNIEIIKLEERKIEEERQEQNESQPQPTVSTQESKKDEITLKDVQVIEQALDSIGKDKKQMAVEKEEIKELKEEMAEYQEDIQELYQIKAEAKGQADIEDIKVSKGAKLLFNKVNKMIQKMDAVLLELENEKQVKQKIDAQNSDETKNTVAAEDLVKIDELTAVIKQIQNVPDENRLARITEILGKIDDDRDGAIKIEDVLKVIELIGKEDIKLSKKQVDELLELMVKEEVLEVEKQVQKTVQKENNTPKKVNGTVNNLSLSTTTSKEKKFEDKITESNTNFTASFEKDTDQVTTVLKTNSSSDSTETTPLTPSVSSKTKKTEGSKRL